MSGRNVLFIGGPEAGNARKIPESQGDKVTADGDYVYWIHAIRMPDYNDVMYFAFDAQRHPMNMFVELWREYSDTSQLKRATGA